MHSLTIAHKSTIKLQHLLHIDFFLLYYYIHLILLSVRCECVFQTKYFSHFSISFFNHCLWFSLRENRCFFLSCFRLPDCIWYRSGVSALCNVHVWCLMHDDRVGCGLLRSIVLSRTEKKIETRSFFVCKKMNCTLGVKVFEEDREIDILLLPYFYSTIFDFFLFGHSVFGFTCNVCVFFLFIRSEAINNTK